MDLRPLRFFLPHDNGDGCKDNGNKDSLTSSTKTPLTVGEEDRSWFLSLAVYGVNNIWVRVDRNGGGGIGGGCDLTSDARFMVGGAEAGSDDDGEGGDGGRPETIRFYGVLYQGWDLCVRIGLPKGAIMVRRRGVDRTMTTMTPGVSHSD